MNKAELVASVAEKSNLSKKNAEKTVDAIVASITEALADGDSVRLVGFGTFETRKRAARKGRNPQTGKKINIAAATVPAFKPGKALKDVLK